MGITNGVPIHCTETISGFSHKGRFLAAEDEIRLELFSFDEPFGIDVDAPIHLIAETGKCVSLHSCISGGGGMQRSYQHTVYSQKIIANVAVVGPTHWTNSDRVKSVSFTVEYSMSLMESRDRIDKIGRAEWPSEDSLALFRDKSNGIVIGARYNGTWGMMFHTPTNLWPVFYIEFDEPKELNDYISYVMRYANFLSFCLGVPLRPSEIFIDKGSIDNHGELEEENAHIPPHIVHYVWPKTDISQRDAWVGGSPVRAYDEEELAAFRACLVCWMDRADLWKSAYALMLSSLKRRYEMTGERLVCACRWFEELPNARSKHAISDKEAEAIVGAAVSKAKEVGLENVADRIATSIARIKEETASERFTRLITTVEEKFGKGILPDNANIHLKRAIQFRGRIAHGHFYPESDEEYRAFSKATYSMEALCFLLTAVDLPISKDGIERIRQNPPLRDYRTAFE